MKISELLKVTEGIKSVVSGAVERAEAKLSAQIDGLRGQIETVAGKSVVSSEELDSYKAETDAKIESIAAEIVSSQPAEPLRVKSIIGEGSTIVVGLTDGSIETIELEIPEAIPGPAGPMGLKGLDGLNGADGIKGLDGRDGTNGVDGKDGKDGKNGRDGKDGLDGVGVKSIISDPSSILFQLSSGDEYKVELPAPIQPEAPRAPIDVTDAMIDRDGRLTIVFSNGTTKDVGVIVGRDGVNGSDGLNGRDGLDGAPGLPGSDGLNGLDGRDGIGFDNLDAELADDGRTVVFRFARGDYVKEFPMKFPVMIYRGGYDSTRVYEAGDVVSYGGSTFHANGETIGVVPDSNKEAWTQQTAAGRSIRGPRGMPGNDGRNGSDGKDLRAFS